MFRWLRDRFAYRGRHRTDGLSTMETMEMSRVVEPGLIDIHDLIDVWHANGGGASVHEFLCLTWDEYCEWVESGRLPEGCGLKDSRR